jgi:flavin reductase
MNGTGPAGARSAPLTSPTEMGAREFRRRLARFSTGVTVVTYETPDGPRGATVNSFSSVSIDPPLILVCLSRKARICAALENRPFAVNVLRSDQMDIACTFAGRPTSDRPIRWQLAEKSENVPFLADAVALFVCKPWRRYDGGDHILQLGEVVGAEARDGAPLVFTDGQFVSTGLPLLDGPMVHGPDGRPMPKWVGAMHRIYTYADAG